MPPLATRRGGTADDNNAVPTVDVGTTPNVIAEITGAIINAVAVAVVAVVVAAAAIFAVKDAELVLLVMYICASSYPSCSSVMMNSEPLGKAMEQGVGSQPL